MLLWPIYDNNNMCENDYMSLIMFLFFILFPTAGSSTFVPPLAQRSDQDIRGWTCSYHQKVWMRTELRSLGLWLGSHHKLKPGNALSPTKLVDRVEKVLRHFHTTTDPNNIQLFKPSNAEDMVYPEGAHSPWVPQWPWGHRGNPVPLWENSAA